MIGNLYKITNNINNKVYVGKTYKSINSRFNGHKRDINRFKSRPLYRAMLKYGIDNFSIELLGSYSEGILEEKEVEAIKNFDSYKNGYNATLGGDGTRYREFDEEQIISMHKAGSSIAEITDSLRCCASSISSILKSNNIDPSKDKYAKAYPRKIAIKEPYKEFNNVSECAYFLIENEIAKAFYRSVTLGINKALSGDRNSYLKLQFIDV
jgi:GIY-YIG catalytic domain